MQHGFQKNASELLDGWRGWWERVEIEVQPRSRSQARQRIVPRWYSIHTVVAVDQRRRLQNLNLNGHWQCRFFADPLISSYGCRIVGQHKHPCSHKQVSGKIALLEDGDIQTWRIAPGLLLTLWMVCVERVDSRRTGSAPFNIKRMCSENLGSASKMSSMHTQLPR